MLKAGDIVSRKNEVYSKVREFANRHPLTIAWRLKAHSRVVEEHINDDEEVLYAFAAQKGASSFDVISTFVVAVTNKRIILAQKRLIFGYFYYSITPDLFNDLTVKMGLIWGRVIIDTVKETVVLSNLSKDSLQEIETVISKYMFQKKREYETELTDEERDELNSELKDMAVHGERETE